MQKPSLYSSIYVLGTALAIAFTMIIAEIYYVKVANIAPEIHRRETYTLQAMRLKDGSDQGQIVTYDVFRDLLRPMKTPTCVTSTMDFWGIDEYYMKLADGQHDRHIRVKLTDPDFFRLYAFTFVEGRPYSQDDFDSQRPVVVVTEEVMRSLGSVSEAIINNRPYRICGVVETPSVLTKDCAADVYIPYTAQGILSDHHFEYPEFPYQVHFLVPSDKRDAFMQELHEVEARYNAVHPDQPVDMTGPLGNVYGSVLYDLSCVFEAWGKNLTWYLLPAFLLLLLVPALNLSGMVAARMQRRLPEMAVRKAFGAKRRTLLWQVIRENLRLTLIGGLVGLCLAWIALYAWRDWVFHIFSGTYGLDPVVPILRGEMLFAPAIFLIALFVCCTLNVLAATLPAWLSLRRPIVEGMMREEEGAEGGWRQKIWLAAELVLVTIACWWAFDPVLVGAYVHRLPLGYDPDRLVQLEVGNTVTQQERSDNFFENLQEEERLLQKVLAMDDVELAYPAYSTPLGFGIVTLSTTCFHENDSLTCWRWNFNRDSRMFEVYGLQSLTPSVPTSELTHDCVPGETVIITRAVAMSLFGTTDVAGRRLTVEELNYDHDQPSWGNWVHQDYRIRAVVEDIRFSDDDRDCTNIFFCTDGSRLNTPIVLRLREGVDAEQFIQRHQRQVETELTMEHCFVRRMQSSRAAMAEASLRKHPDRLMRRNLLIAAFFGVNLALGVFGTLLMYTRQRREEAGVRRAFGATRWRIFRGFIREAFVLTTICVAVGCIIYFQFAITRGLYDGFSTTNPSVRLWFDSFGPHFLIVSACVYLIILCTVVVGTALPAWHICRSEIVEAIKEEG